MTTLKKSSLISTVATLLSLVVLARPAAAQSYNAAGDFSTASNPNGAWSYGSSGTLGSAFTPSSIPTNNFLAAGVGGWFGMPGGGNAPYILHNGSAHNVTNNSSVYLPGQLIEQPGNAGQYSVVRWTAPFSGTLSINATFAGLSSLGDDADVHILLDGSSIFNSTVIGSPNPKSFSGLESITAGDTLDFVVGPNGGNGNEDNTSLSATIVPEPGTLGLVAMAFSCLLSFRFLKRK